MTFTQAVSHNFRHYADFSGRAPRSQYWWWVLFVLIGHVVLALADRALNLPMVADTWGLLTIAWVLVLLLPGMAVFVRRLHDTGRSAWWLLILYAAPLIAFVFGVMGASVALVGAVDSNEGVTVGGAILAGVALLIALAIEVVAIVFLASRGTTGPNKYGPDPLISV